MLYPRCLLIAWLQLPARSLISSYEVAVPFENHSFLLLCAEIALSMCNVPFVAICLHAATQTPLCLLTSDLFNQHFQSSCRNLEICFNEVVFLKFVDP